jgi:hypothetical protein
MKRFVIVGILLQLGPPSCHADPPDRNHDDVSSFPWTKAMLDDMAAFFECSGTSYPEEDYEDIKSCFHKWDDPMLEAAQDASWFRFFEYYIQDGNGTDTWGSEPPEYQERKDNKASLFGDDPQNPNRRYLILEPCNYVSNVAFYRAMYSICLFDDQEGLEMPVIAKRAMKQSLATLAAGSFWWHGSFTAIGRIVDATLISLHVNNAYFIMTESLTSESRIIQSLRNDTDRPDLVELNTNVSQRLFLETPVWEWDRTIQELPIRLGYQQTILATISFICVMTNRFETCDFLVRQVFTPAFNDAQDNLKNFILDEYLPALKQVAQEESFPISFWRAKPLWCKTVSVIAAFLWSLSWQEVTIDLFPGTLCQYLAWIGQGVVFAVDTLLAWVTGYSIPDPAMASRRNVYPGSGYCNRYSSHALWHQESADVMYELVRLTDDVRTALRDHQARTKK